MVKVWTEQEKQQELEQVLIHEQAEKSSALAKGQCGVCKRVGYPIFLVRKAVITKGCKPINGSQNICSLGEREPQVSLETHEYVYRTLRKGYVYILAQSKAGEWEYMGYEVTSSGALRHKTIHDMKERNIKEIPISCHKEGHRIKGSFITIDTTVYEGEAYVAYTRRAWSKSTRDNYIKLVQQQHPLTHQGATQATAAAANALKRFSKITLNQASYAKPEKLSAQGRSFSFNDFYKDKKLLELACSQQDIGYVTEGDNTDHFNYAQYVFTTCHQFNSLQVNPTTKDHKQHSAALAAMQSLCYLSIRRPLWGSRRALLSATTQN